MSNGALAGLSMTRNIGSSSRLAVMCGFAGGHILRSLEPRDVASANFFRFFPGRIT
jgi:hypothetical protein